RHLHVPRAPGRRDDSGAGATDRPAARPAVRGSRVPGLLRADRGPGRVEPDPPGAGDGDDAGARAELFAAPGDPDPAPQPAARREAGLTLMPHSYFHYNSRARKSDPQPDFRTSVAREFYKADAYFKGDLDSLDLNYKKTMVGSLAIFKAAYTGRAICGVQRSW